jgi:hypothetical protein
MATFHRNSPYKNVPPATDEAVEAEKRELEETIAVVNQVLVANDEPAEEPNDEPAEEPNDEPAEEPLIESGSTAGDI